MNRKMKAAASVVALAAAGLTLAACTATSSSQQQAQATTEAYASKLTAAEPYPLSQMNDSAERANLREKLLRMNDPNKIGYVYELSQTGQVIAEYTIKGKVSSNQSQLTNTQNCYYAGSTSCGSVMDSMSDDGSYGANEPGVFFFTTNGVLVEWDGPYQYSDAPLTLTSAPLLTMDATKKPSSTAGQIK